MSKPAVWIHPGVVILYGSNLDANYHKHNAIQVIWPQKNTASRLNGDNLTTLVVIDSNVEHQLQMSMGWILLIEPKSELGRVLSSKLDKQKTIAINSTYTGLVDSSANIEQLNRQLAPLFVALEITAPNALTNKPVVQDRRIQSLLSELERCLHGECIKPVNWRARDVAHQLALSESRFLHLFSDEMGITWRPYLLWRRMICALAAIVDGASATDAAHSAGFSDSAHLSRTFRNTFGMTFRQAQSLFK